MQPSVACESVNYTIDIEVDLHIYDYNLSLDFFTLEKVELSLIWAQLRCVNLPRVQTLQLWLDKNSLGIQYKDRRLLLHGRDGAIFAIIAQIIHNQTFYSFQAFKRNVKYIVI